MAKRYPIPNEQSLFPCAKCNRKLLMVHNLATGKAGPVEPGAVVYVVRLDRGIAGTPAQTAADFMDSIEGVVLKGGEMIEPEKLRFYVAHFSTCTDPGFFSRRDK